MVSSLRSRESQDRWRKEHGLIVRMSDEQTNALVSQGWDALWNHCSDVGVQCWYNDQRGSREDEQQVHGELFRRSRREQERREGEEPPSSRRGGVSCFVTRIWCSR